MPLYSPPLTIELINGTPQVATLSPPVFGQKKGAVHIGGLDNYPPTAYPTTRNQNGQAPGTQSFACWTEIGINLFRLPVLWSCLAQTPQQAELNAVYLADIVATIETVGALGGYVIVDWHGFGYAPGGFLIGNPGCAPSAFAAAWVAFIKALQTAGVTKWVAGWELQNEPEIGAPELVLIYNTAIAAIRQVDAETPIVLDGAAYANPDYKTYSPQFFGPSGIIDPSKRVIFTGHYYFDGSGTDYEWFGPSGVAAKGALTTSGQNAYAKLVSATYGTGFKPMAGEFGFAYGSTGFLLGGLKTLTYAMNENMWTVAFSGGPSSGSQWGPAFPFFMSGDGLITPQRAVIQWACGNGIPQVAKGATPQFSGKAAPGSTVYYGRLGSGTYETAQHTAVADAQGVWTGNAGLYGGKSVYVASGVPFDQDYVVGGTLTPLAAVCLEQLT